ncbi:alpha/beta-hydrolase [Artomyces pyxidatus]|uniref:Alpha/beta-hydrolase n=1 Tax=Artomyces pyxidatus TaxID=48021 RepID=A0ACB8SU15_9AGAM|nr:alpha/beta-hydrolase [Artomyces pyxidatus]
MHYRSLLFVGGFFSFFTASLAADAQTKKHVFNVREYPKRIATCKATNRALGEEVDIQLHYVDINPQAEKTIIMVHGWPGLWSSWKYQIEEFANDYHLIVPDLRGFGASGHPGDVKASGTLQDIVGDLACILADANVSTALCMGHDWGSVSCYEAARSRPDLFEAVIGITVPYIPAHGEAFTPVKELTKMLPKLSYQLFFDEKTEDAVAELARDVRRSLRATLRAVDSPPPADFLLSTESFLEGWKDVEDIPPIPYFTADEEDYLVEQYSIGGFKHTLHFYTDENRRASWELAHEQGNHTISLPVLSVLPTKDTVADWVLATKILGTEKYITDYTVELVHGSHWIQLENPEHVNAAIRNWLDGLSARPSHPHDEL